MMSKHTLKLFAVAFAFVAAAAALWGSSTPVERAGAASAPSDRAAMPPGAPTASVVLLAQQDAWVDEGALTTNFGSDPKLHVGRVSAQVAVFNRRTLVQFDLSSLPAGVTIVSAKLQLYQVDWNGSTQYNIWPDAVLRTAWTEAAVTWATQPPFVNQGDPPVAIDTSNGWKTWDVSNIVGNWLSGKNENLGIVLRGDGDTIGERIFGARNDSKTAPRLIVQFDRPRPTATRTPLPTWTPIPSPTPTIGPKPTATSPVPAYAYLQYGNFNTAILNPIDLSIYGIEITQGIQCFDPSKGLPSITCPDNSLPVVAKKDSTARIYLKYSGSGTGLNNVPVRLHIFANGVNYTVNASGKAKPTLSQANADDAVNIWFNVNFSNDVLVTFWAEVDPDHTIAETNELNNRYPAVGTIDLTFRKRATMMVVGQRLRYHPSGYGGAQYAGGWAVNGGGADWWEQVLPIRNNGINYVLANGYLDWTQSLGSGDGQHALISTLNTRWILENVFAWMFGGGAYTGARHVYGWAPSAGYSGGHADMPIYPHAGGLGVVGIGSDAPGTSTDNPGSGALIFGHELTHDYNVFHTNTADGCGSNDSNSDFPYGSSSIQEFGFNPITGKVYNPANTHDLMSYCPSGGSKQGWISPFTWSKMFNDIAPSAPHALSATSIGAITPTLSTESLAVHVTISNPLYYNGQVTGTLHDLYRVETGLVSPVINGDYAIELRDGPTVLSSQTFTVSFESEYDGHGGPQGNTPNNDPPPFPPEPTTAIDASFVIPWQIGTTSIAVTHNGLTIDEKPVSPNSPVVTITAPTQIVTWTTAINTLNWTATDADGDPLHYAVFYSSNGGTNWSLLVEGLSTTSYNVDATALAGGSDTRFRVVATDGVNTGFDETPMPIVIPDKTPYVTITNPPPGLIVRPGDLLVLQGTATDLEDGGLPDEALNWSSDKQGGLGTGPSVALNVLITGTHVITLSVNDSQGHIGTATVSVFIGYPTYLPLIRK